MKRKALKFCASRRIGYAKGKDKIKMRMGGGESACMRHLHTMRSSCGNGNANLTTLGLKEFDINTEHPEMPEEEGKVILYTTDDGKA